MLNRVCFNSHRAGMLLSLFPNAFSFVVSIFSACRRHVYCSFLVLLPFYVSISYTEPPSPAGKSTYNNGLVLQVDVFVQTLGYAHG